MSISITQQVGKITRGEDCTRHGEVVQAGEGAELGLEVGVEDELDERLQTAGRTDALLVLG